MFGRWLRSSIEFYLNVRASILKKDILADHRAQPVIVTSKLSWIPKEVVSGAGVASTSRGLVGDTHFAVLPDVQPGHCFLLTIVVQLVPSHTYIFLWKEY